MPITALISTISQKTRRVMPPLSDCESIQPSPLPPWSVSTSIEAVIAIGAEIFSPVKKYGMHAGISVFV